MMRIFKLSAIITLVLLAGMSNSYANVTFDSVQNGNCYPFGSCPTNTIIEYQQFYSHYMFGTAPIEITGISFKPDPGKVSDFGPIPVSFTLTLSTTLSNVGSIYGDFATKPITTTFSENLGVNTNIVFSGTATLSSSGNDVFDINIPFATPFLYDPLQGNLVLGVTNIQGGIPLLGFAAGATPLLSRFVNGTYGGAPNIFVEPSYGLATQFISESNPMPEPFPDVPPSPVPEISESAMLLAGLGMLTYLSRRRSPKKLDDSYANIWL